MRLLQLNKYYAPHIGGVESIVKDLAEGFSSFGWDVTTIVCHDKPGLSTTSAQTTGGRIITCRTWLTLFRLPLSFAFFTHVWRATKHTEVILIHHPFPLGFLAWLLCAHKKTPCVVFYHSDIVRQRRLARLLRPLFTHVLHRAKRLIVTSQTLADHSPLLIPEREHVTVQPLWIDPSLFEKTEIIDKAAQQLRAQTPALSRLLCIGRLVYYKGYDVLLEAMNRIPSAHLTIIGEGPEHERLTTFIKQHHLADRVKIIPPVADVRPFYFAADIFVLPSTHRTEAFGLVQLEAMMCGIPVINTDLPTGVPEVSLHKQTGLTVPPNDHMALAHAIQLLVTSPEQRILYGNQARTRAKQFHKTDAIARLHMQLQSLMQK